LPGRAAAGDSAADLLNITPPPAHQSPFFKIPGLSRVPAMASPDPAFTAYSSPQVAAVSHAPSAVADSPRYPFDPHVVTAAHRSYANGGSQNVLERRGGGGDATDEGFTVITPRYVSDSDNDGGRGGTRGGGFVGSFMRSVGFMRELPGPPTLPPPRGIGVSSAREAAAVLQQQRRAAPARRGGSGGPLASRHRCCGCCSVPSFVCCLVGVAGAGVLLWLAVVLRVVAVSAPAMVPPAAASGAT